MPKLRLSRWAIFVIASSSYTTRKPKNPSSLPKAKLAPPYVIAGIVLFTSNKPIMPQGIKPRAIILTPYVLTISSSNISKTCRTLITFSNVRTLGSYLS